MNDIEADKKATPADRGESLGLMEPLVLPQASPHRPALSDLSIELATASAGFRRSLADGIVNALADLVRSMNCYYSNLIEGHDTHPVDIERALRKDYSADPKETQSAARGRSPHRRAEMDRRRRAQGPCNERERDSRYSQALLRPPP